MSSEAVFLIGQPAKPPSRRLLTGRGRLRGRRRWIVAALVVLPLISVLLRSMGTPPGHVLDRILSLEQIGGRTGHTLDSILLVPLAAVIIVFFRVTLGVRVLGPFRSFLLAMAFHATGIPIGLLFFAAVLAITVLVRRRIQSIRLPYYGRVSVILSTVAVTIIATISLGRWLGLPGLSRVALFPIVALCLAGEAFAGTLKREGWRSALWRAAATAATAVLITWLAEIRPLARTLVRFPELLLVEIGLIIVISEHFGHRLLASLNPPPRKRKRAKKRPSGKTSAGKSADKTSTRREDAHVPTPAVAAASRE